MLPYSVNGRIRYLVLLAVFFGSSLLQPAIAKLFSSYVNIPGLVTGSISTLAICGAVYWVFDVWLWSKLEWFGFQIVPNFSGRWLGYIERRELFQSTNAVPTPAPTVELMMPVEMRISQTFASVSITLKSPEEHQETTFNQSTTAVSIGWEDIKVPKLRYMFSRPNLSGEATLELHRDSSGSWLTGVYTSNKPRVGKMSLRRIVPESDNIVCVTLTELRSRAGDRYLGATISPAHVATYLELFRLKVGARRFNALRDRQAERDGPAFHVTVIEPKEYANLLSGLPGGSGESRLSCDGRMVWLKLGQLGVQRIGSNESYYIISVSDRIQEIRKGLGLPEKHLHITLGFHEHDIYGVNKGPETAVRIRGGGRIARLLPVSWR